MLILSCLSNAIKIYAFFILISFILKGEEEDAELLQEIIDAALPKTRPRSEPGSSKECDGLFKKPIGLPPKPKARRSLNV